MEKVLPESVQAQYLSGQLSPHEWQQLFELTPLGIGIFDREFRCRYANEAFAGFSGLPIAELLGSKLSDISSSQAPLINQQAGQTAFRPGSTLHPHNIGHGHALCSPMQDEHGAPDGLLVIVHDLARASDQHITPIGLQGSASRQFEQLCQAQARLHHLAYHDALTSLGNRSLLQERLELELKTAQLNQQKFALLFIDLDGFKQINDTLGHRAGDQLLRLLADRIRRSLGQGDLAVRLGGDEFLVLIPCMDRQPALTALVEQLQLSLHAPAELGHDRVTPSASIGIALYPDHGQSPDRLISAASNAMREAKRRGRNGYLFYSHRMAEQMRERMVLEQGLLKAMDQQQFRVLYQPMADLANNRLSGLEALLRWQHPSEGMISPARFIPVAEQCGLIEQIGEWVMRTACQQGQRWLAQGLAVPRLSVNVSVREMQSPDYVERVTAILAETGFPAERLEIEVTESIIQSVDQSLHLFTRLKALGVQIAIDDFGTGFSSLSLLKSLPIDRIKIDRTFVQALPDDKHSRELCRTIVHLADSLGMAVTAEGIETQSQRRFLQSLHCEEGQGYLFSHPLSKSHLATKLTPHCSALC